MTSKIKIRKRDSHTHPAIETQAYKSHIARPNVRLHPENFAPENFNFWVRPQPLLPNDFLFIVYYLLFLEERQFILLSKAF